MTAIAPGEQARSAGVAMRSAAPAGPSVAPDPLDRRAELDLEVDGDAAIAVDLDDELATWLTGAVADRDLHRGLHVGAGVDLDPARPAEPTPAPGGTPGAGATVAYDVVVPTVGRPSLAALLDGLLAGPAPRPTAVVVVDDRPGHAADHPLPVPFHPAVRVVRGRAAGPAAARNVGWRSAASPWVVFVDDDVVLDPSWRTDLLADLAAASDDVGGVQGDLRVPLPTHRRPTDRERQVGALASARWITADMAYRRSALELVGGFDESFPRAHREDADLALRVGDAGWTLARGSRRALHPVAPAPWWASVTRQVGNADDARMAVRHGRAWRVRSGAAPTRMPTHLLTVAAGLLLASTPWHRRPRLALAAAVTWVATTAAFAARRVRPGPRTPGEVAAMVLTSAAIPPVAVAARVAGSVERGRLVARLGRGPVGRATSYPDAVLVDRDGTIVEDVPYNGDPEAVRPVAGARAALDRLRAAGIPVAVVSNQSGVARGLLRATEVDAVNARVAELLGPFAAVEVCPHGEGEGCGCRKPAPGLLLAACDRLGADPTRTVMIGDIGADVAAARAAGCRPLLVPNRSTRPEEVAAAPEVVADLHAAVDLLLGGHR